MSTLTLPAPTPAPVPAPAVVHAHRWGHGRPSPRPPDALLSDDERLGLVPVMAWPTPLLCLDCGELWPGQPVQPIYGRERS
jgi:hypothetical protein